MAETPGNDLRSCRELRELTQWAAAQAIGISEYTLARWEKGESYPDPDDVWRLEKLYKAPGLWHRWMRQRYASYREAYPEALDLSLPVSVVNLRHQMEDVLALQGRMERDALDGTVDDEAVKARYLAELDDLNAAVQEARRKLR